MSRFLFLALALLFTLPSFALVEPDFAVKEWPVQHGGRIKPFDTLASESMSLIYGKKKYKKKEPVFLVLTWLLDPKTWSEIEFIQIKNRKLKDALGVAEKKEHFSQKELASNAAIESLFQNLQVKQKKEIKLSSFDQALSRLQGQLFRLSEFQSGEILKFAPSSEGDKWKSVREFSKDYEEGFSKVLKSLSVFVTDEENKEAKQSFEKASREFASLIYKNQKSDSLKLKNKMQVEVFYNKAHPFRWAWVSYLLGLFLVFGFWLTKKVWFKKGFFAFFGLAFLLHLLGFVIRVYISGRAPVSNMYETVLWVPFGTVVFGVLVGRATKGMLSYVGASVVAVLCLIVSDLAPVILDPSIQPLQAVLRSNFWLTTHVLTITISYSAFFLAFILGDFSVFFHLNENRYRKEIANLNQAIYRSLQIGVLLLAVGTVLGGVWADYSWGRFWGWDPKETWAFIALVGYLALLHARLVGMVKAFGMAVGSILAMSLVLMAWYGVNFWLGAGLHSYGFGSGGVREVSLFVLAHIFYVIFVAVFRKFNKERLSK